MKKILLTILFVLPIMIFADTYTLDNLISEGLKNSFDMQNEEFNLESAKTDVTTSYLTLLPSGSLSANKSYSNDEWNLISSGFSMSQSVAWNDSRYFSITQTLKNKESANLSYIDRKKRFVFDLFSKYINVLKTQKNIEILKENYALQEKTTNRIKIKYKTGNAALLDVKQSEISLLSYNIEITDAESKLDNMRYDLFSFINIEDKGKEFEDIKIDVENVNINNIFFKKNNTIKISQNNFENQKLSLLQQKLNLFPSLSFSTSYNFGSTYPYDFLNFKRYQSSFSMGISFSYSIFDIPFNNLNYARSKRKLHLQYLTLGKSISDEKIRFIHLKKDLRSLKKSYLLEKQKLTLAEDNFELAQAQFNLGYISLLDFEQNKINLINSKLTFNNKYYDILTQIENLKLQISSEILNEW